MRTATEIRKKFKFFKSEGICSDGNSKFMCRKLEEMINEARKETIEEIAEFSEKYFLYDACENDCGIKEKILSLIKELK